MSFMNEVKKTLGDEFNYSATENGALGYRTTQNALLDMNFKVSSLRSASEEEIIDYFMKAFLDEPILAMKWLFFARDVRGGLGERRLFRVIISHLSKREPGLVTQLIPWIGEYGRFDDILAIYNSSLKAQVATYIKAALESDLKAMEAGTSCTLLAKWMPSINASSQKTKELGRSLAKDLGLTERQYRKVLSKLRKYIDIVESKMSSQNWSEIDYEKVPSKANLKYNGAFLRHDEARRRDFLGALERGEAKINSSVAYPSDIVHSYSNSYGWSVSLKSYDSALEGMWKALPTPEEDCGNTLVVRDGSGSMTVNIGGGTNMTALEVSTALAIYFSERCVGEFKDNFITFSANPKMISLSGCKNLHDKLERTYREDDCSNTDIYKVFKLILNSAVRSHMNQSEMPKQILILSDMEFDARSHNCSQRLFTTIAQEYQAAGYQLPRLVFWNLNSRTGTIPVTENELGVALISGFSTNLMKMVISEKTDPYESLLEVLNSERYKFIEGIMN